MPRDRRARFDFGGGNAESDPLLEDAYLDNGDYHSLETRDDPRRFVIGRFGAGKSAALLRLEAQHGPHVARIHPENLSLQYVANLGVAKRLTERGVHLEIFFKALWKHVIIVELLKHRYPNATESTQRTVLQSLITRLGRDPVKKQAIDYVTSFGDTFWCEAPLRVKQVAETLEKEISASAAVPPSPGAAPIAAGYRRNHSSETVALETARYQKTVDDIQLPKLNHMIQILSEEILDSEQHFTYLVIDDLDRQWHDSAVEKLIVYCLFETIVDLQRIRVLKVIVALRTNIFLQLTRDEFTWMQQSEKFRNLSLDLHWTRGDLTSLLEQRAQAAYRRVGTLKPKALRDILPAGRRGGETALDYILSRTLLRPRDAITYVNLCLRRAGGKDSISWDDITGVEREYSRDRLQTVGEEWSDPFQGLTKVLEQFAEHTHEMSRDELTEILLEVVVHLLTPSANIAQSLRSLCAAFEASGTGTHRWFEEFGPLVNLLFNIGFLGCSTKLGEELTFVSDDPTYAGYESNFPPESRFQVHPMFRKALSA